MKWEKCDDGYEVVVSFKISLGDVFLFSIEEINKFWVKLGLKFLEVNVIKKEVGIKEEFVIVDVINFMVL